MKYRPMILASLLLLLAVPAAADQAGWSYIGEHTVDPSAGRDEIDAYPIVYASHLRLCASRQAIQLRELDVFYRNGNQERVAVQALVPAGRCTTDIALSDEGARDIAKIGLSYQAASGELAPRVVVFARPSRVRR